MFGRIKRNIGHRILKKQRKHQQCKRQFHNFNTAKSVGILYLYDPTTENDIQMLVRFLAERNIKAQLLAYSPESKPPQSFITTVNKRLFHKEQLNWFGKPVAGEVDNFIQSPFDILIDFSYPPCYPMQYIATLSHAQMRVGKIAYPDNPYEFILTIPEQDNNKFFIEQLKHYLLSIQIK
ncbi:MAG: hypothetical protein LBD87_03185 [Prevotellaceae bacterium]|jgi:hypothetical protein|nr:hypothetical protein [Prevotellaceae bacterium]